MKISNLCPCCSDSMLRHARNGEIYWFCSHCRQEMPNLLSNLVEKRTPRVAARTIEYSAR